MSWSSVAPSLAMATMPLRSKAHCAEPPAPRAPLFFSNTLRISATVRFLLSVIASQRKSVPPGPVPS